MFSVNANVCNVAGTFNIRGDNYGLPLVNAGMISSAGQMTAILSCKVNVRKNLISGMVQ